MTLELPRAAPASAEKFYTPRRVRHGLSHWRCDIAFGYMPGHCNNDPFNDELKRRHVTGEPSLFEVAALRSDLYGAWHHLTGHLERIVIGVVDIGPRERLESDKEWRDRRLDWWEANRMRFGRQPAGRLLHLANVATEEMARTLGWVPDPEETT
jgi:hypothetical protein